MPTDRLHTPIPPLMNPILHEEPRLRFETFEYHPSYPGNDSFPFPDRTEAMIAMMTLWQPLVDRYWKTVREWITAKNEERDKIIARKEAREAKERAERKAEEEAEKKKAEKDKLRRIAEQERDAKVIGVLEGRKRKRSEKDVGDPTKKKKKCPQSQKSVPTVVELKEEGEGREERIIASNQAKLLAKGIEIVEESSLHVSHVSSKYSGEPRKEPCNRCRYWIMTRGCATWICREVVGGRVCATCTASNLSCVTTGEAIQREKKSGGTPKKQALGSKTDEEGRPEIFDHLGFVEADLDTLKQTIGDLRDLTRVQVMSQLLTYHLFEANSVIRPPGFQEQREEYRRSTTEIFGKDHLGEDRGKPGGIGDADEEDASGEEVEDEYPDETLGRDDSVVDGQDLAPGNAELSEESETGVVGSGNESETESEKVRTPKTKVPVLVMESEESEGSTKMSETSSDEEEGSDEESGDYLPSKGKKLGK
ncbi:hypothetical protein M422DRAFT_266929 [Sphaerobolus stellatus SS14]|uniref:Uncharacterized protein n=1 Tax=Sphaerobolus stellatus (strain SS14) TaxID=990650 RepID=A0A0C9TN36_SPHS4|nr:hypothetical protein M422DRAFT_266929 [Sphaerobolus stellatus SS14]